MRSDRSASRRTPRGIPIRYVLTFILFMLSAVAFLDRTNLSIAGLAVSREYGLGNERLGWVFSAFLLGYACCQLPAGWLAARFGPRRVLTVATVWWAAATALTAVLPSGMRHAVAILIAIRFLLGMGESVVYPAGNQFVARWVPRDERGLVNGVIFAGVGAGSGLTPPFLAWLIARHGWRAAFWFSAAAGLAVGMAWWFWARDVPEEQPAISAEECARIEQGLAATGAAGEGESAPAWGAMWRRVDLPALMVAYFSFGYVAWIFFSWFYLYLAQVRGFDLKASARFTMLPFLSMTVCCLLGGVWSDWLARRRGLRAARSYLASGALVATAVLLVAGSAAKSPQMAGLILALGAGTLYLSQSSFWSASVDLAGRSSGLFSSAVNMGGQMGGALTASLTPWVAQRFGWTTSFEVAAALAIAGALSWLLVHPERPLTSGEQEWRQPEARRDGPRDECPDRSSQESTSRAMIDLTRQQETL